VEFAEVSRREGLLALEERAQATNEPFLQKGIQLIVDGTDAELVRNILEIELVLLGGAPPHRPSSIFEQMGAVIAGLRDDWHTDRTHSHAEAP
jgi:chemotaxis protein MotA